jgi:hypothetical protein
MADLQNYGSAGVDGLATPPPRSTTCL